MSERPLPRWRPPFLTAPDESAAENRLLRRSLAAAVVIHGVLLALPISWTVSKVAAEPPVVIPVHRLAQLRPPEPPQPPVHAPEPPTPRDVTVTIPVPDFDPPEPLDQPTPLPAPDLAPLDPGPELAAGIFDAPPPPPPPDEPVLVVGDVLPPEKLYAPQPRFPEIERRIGRGGLVVVRAVIERDGSVGEVTVLRGASPALDEAAVEAVRTWRFRPATLKNKPVTVYYQLTVRFRVMR